MNLDLAKLRETVKTNPAFGRLLSIIAECRGKKSQMSARLLTNKLQNHTGNRVPHEEIISGLRLLEGAGAGQLVEPNSQDRARFAWRVRPHSLVASVFDPGLELVPSDFLRAADRSETVEKPSALPPGWLHYRFPLRENVEILFDLPGDLTDAEARRLGHLLQAAARHE